MYLTYLDEAFNGREFYVTALMIEGSNAIELTKNVNSMVEQLSWDHGSIRSNAELHGASIMNGSDDWSVLKGNYQLQMEVFEEAIDVICASKPVIYIRGLEAKGYQRRYPGSKHIHMYETALAWTLERVQGLCQVEDTTALVIADDRRGEEKRHRRSLRSYQRREPLAGKRQYLIALSTPSISRRLTRAASYRLLTSFPTRTCVPGEHSPIPIRQRSPRDCGRNYIGGSSRKPPPGFPGEACVCSTSGWGLKGPGRSS